VVKVVSDKMPKYRGTVVNKKICRSTPTQLAGSPNMNQQVFRRQRVTHISFLMQIMTLNTEIVGLSYHTSQT